MVEPRRLITFAALLVAAAAVVVILTGSGGGYTVQARFLDAGQLVKGNLVQVAGSKVGEVKRLSLTDDGRAEVRISIDDTKYRPLHRGTRMTIRSIGLSGIANRYIDITPGAADAPKIEDGGVLDTTETQGIVDLDMVLDALDRPARRDLRNLIIDGADGLHGNATAANRVLAFLNPAVGQTRALLEDVVLDQAAVDRLIRSGATVSAALASRRTDVEAGIGHAATALSAVAAERDALQSTLVRAPAVMRQARGTLAGVRETLAVVRPALREAQPSAPRLATFLRRFVPAARHFGPVLRDVRALVDPLQRTLESLPGLARAGLPAVRSATSAISAGMPIFRALRAYGLDVIAGAVRGPGDVGGYYDANGGFIRVAGSGSFVSTADGVLSLVPDVQPPPFTGLRTELTARCPGAATRPAGDGSSPVHDPSLCETEDDGR